MEINNISTPKAIRTETKKQPEKIRETGLKEDQFQKTYDVNTVMKGIEDIEIANGQKKFRYPKIVDHIRETLTKEPAKCEYAAKLAPQENITQMGLRNILDKNIDDIKVITDILTTKDKQGNLKFTETNTTEIYKNCTPEERLKIKELATSVLEGDNIIKVAKEKDLDIKKVAQKSEEMSKMFPEDELLTVTFARDAFSKGDYTIKAENYNRETYTEILDHKLNRYALEETKGYISNNSNKEYKIKKVTDFRNNTTAKTRFEKIDGMYQATHEIRILKDKKGNVKRTEYTEPSQIKGVMDIKYVYPNGEVKQVSSGKVDPKTGITSIKKDMVSTSGTRTEYLFEDDPQGNRISDYKITDKNGKVLLQNSESFEVVAPNKFISAKNNERYEITADDESVNVKDMNNPERTATFKRGVDIVGDEEEIMKVLKKMPGEELLKLKKNVAELEGTTEILRSYSRTGKDKRTIHTGDDLFVILHELGHAVDMKDVDMNNLENTIQNAIFEDEKFNKIYAKEKDAFNKAFPDAQRNHIAYFINHETHYNGEIGGRKETIAESNALLTTAKTHEVLAMRSQYLQQHFPETIAYLHGKLNS
ncbi:hypothetical protein IJ843_04950 [bacterium]|nr:hypothetical protein [bacterium]